MSGLVERPGDVGTSGRRVHLVINGRVVRDTGITRAAEAAYRTTIAPGLRPTLFLYIVVAADAVDVNVHPAKAEVRFRDRWQTERAVEEAVRRALGTVDAAAPLGRGPWPAPGPAFPSSAVGVAALQSRRPDADGLFAAPPDLRSADAERSAATMATADDDIPPLVQLRRTYLMAERDDGLLVIDQHSAHERVLR